MAAPGSANMSPWFKSGSEGLSGVQTHPQNETNWLCFASPEFRACPRSSYQPHRRNWCSRSCDKPGSYSVPAMEGAREVLSMPPKQQGLNIGQGCSFTNTGGCDWKWGKWRGTGQETTHIHHEGLSANMLQFHEGLPWPAVLAQKVTFSRLPSKHSTVGAWRRSDLISI